MARTLPRRRSPAQPPARPPAARPGRPAAPAARHHPADARPLPRLRRARRRRALGPGDPRRGPSRASSDVPPRRFFTRGEFACLCAFCDVVLAQDAEPRIPVLELRRRQARRRPARRLPARRHARRPRDLAAGRSRASTRPPARHGATSFAPRRRADAARDRRAPSPTASCAAASGTSCPSARAWTVVMRAVLAAFYSHPWAWNEIGFGGPAYPRGYMRLGRGPGGREPRRGARGVRARPGRGRPAARDAMSDSAQAAGQGRRRPRGQRLARSCSTSTAAAFPGAATMRRYARRRRGRPGDRRRRRGRRRRSPSAWRGAAGGSWSSSPARSGTPTATGSPTRPAATSSTGPRSG